MERYGWFCSLQRMHEENDFENIDAIFFTTSQVGNPSLTQLISQHC